MKKINWHLFGIALSFIGIQWGMLLSYFFPAIPGTALMMALSILCILDIKSCLNKSKFVFNKILFMSLLFQVIMLLYLYLTYGKFNAGFVQFHIYMVAFIVVLSLQKQNFDFSPLPNYLYIVSIIPLIMESFLCGKGLVIGHAAWEQRQMNSAYALEPFAFAQGALVNMFAAFCITTKKLFLKKILVLISVVLGVYVLLSCGKRTPLVVFGVGTICVLYWHNLISLKINAKIFKIFCIISFMSVMSVLLVPWFQERLLDFVDNTYAGILNLLGNESIRDVTGSASERVFYRNFAYDYISENFNVFNYLFGGGYAVMWLDNPLLQSFLDMGLLGFLLYAYLILLFPIKTIAKKNTNQTFIMTRLLSLYAIVSVFNSGHPYMWIKYAPVCVLSVVFFNLKRKKQI